MLTFSFFLVRWMHSLSSDVIILNAIYGHAMLNVIYGYVMLNVAYGYAMLNVVYIVESRN